MGEHANVGAIDHAWLKKFEESNIFILSLELTHILDFLQLDLNEEVICISLAMN